MLSFLGILFQFVQRLVTFRFPDLERINTVIFPMCLSAAVHHDNDYIFANIRHLSKEQILKIIEKAHKHKANAKNETSNGELLMKIAKNAEKYKIDICQDKIEKDEFTVAHCLASVVNNDQAAGLVYDACQGDLTKVAKSRFGGNLLCTAACAGNLVFLKRFHQRSDPKKVVEYCKEIDSMDKSLMHHSIHSLEICQFIFEISGRNQDLLKDSNDNKMSSPLGFACKNGKLKTVKWLLEVDKGINVAKLKKCYLKGFHHLEIRQLLETYSFPKYGNFWEKLICLPSYSEFCSSQNKITRQYLDMESVDSDCKYVLYRMMIIDLHVAFERFLVSLQSNLYEEFHQLSNQALGNEMFPIEEGSHKSLLEKYLKYIGKSPISNYSLQIPFKKEVEKPEFLEAKSPNSVWKLRAVLFSMRSSLVHDKLSNPLGPEMFTDSDFKYRTNRDETIDYLNGLVQRLCEGNFQPTSQDALACQRLFKGLTHYLQKNMEFKSKKQLEKHQNEVNNTLEIEIDDFFQGWQAFRLLGN